MSSKTKADYESGKIFWRRKLTRIYISGLAALAVLYLGWSVLKQFSPWFEQFADPFTAVVISIVILVLVPPVLGVLIHYAVNPVLGRWNTWSELVRLEEQLVDGIADEIEFKVVIVDWPSDKVRSIGLLTRRFPASENVPEMGAVFVPAGARGKSGNMRLVAVEDLVELDWSFKQFQLYQLTLGAVSPPALLDN